MHNYIDDDQIYLECLNFQLLDLNYIIFMLTILNRFTIYTDLKYCSVTMAALRVIYKIAQCIHLYEHVHDNIYIYIYIYAYIYVGLFIHVDKTDRHHSLKSDIPQTEGDQTYLIKKGALLEKNNLQGACPYLTPATVLRQAVVPRGT